MGVQKGDDMRKSLADLVRAAGVNLEEEYNLFHRLVTNAVNFEFKDVIRKCLLWENSDVLDYGLSFLQVCNRLFYRFDLARHGTARTLEDFNRYFHLSFFSGFARFEMDTFLTKIEYVLTLEKQLRAIIQDNKYAEYAICNYIEEYIRGLISRLHYRLIWDGPYSKLVEDDRIVTEVASRLPGDVAIKTFNYRHRSMKGNLMEKKQALKLLGDELEPQRKSLEASNGDLCDNIFFLLNNANIRHNNIAKEGKNYNSSFAELSDSGKEKIYNDLYDMMVAAFALLNVGKTIEACAEMREQQKKSGD